jgi:DNA repair protein RadA/Sms
MPSGANPAFRNGVRQNCEVPRTKQQSSKKLAKNKVIFSCTACGVTFPKWMGRCTACGEWNTITEEMMVLDSVPEQRTRSWQSEGMRKEKEAQPVLVSEVRTGQTHRIVTLDNELNRVLGGGIVSGSLVLIGGQPGIGKSTLLLQMALAIRSKVLYVSGEESEEQIKLRADRLSAGSADCYLLTETNTARILNQAAQLRPEVLIVDSIQTLSSPYVESAAGSISQVRESASELQRFAKETNIPVFIIGHITKDGSLAGPKLLEHIVDVVLQFEGDRNYSYRILRTLKNRFGSTDELGIYEMTAGGMREVSNPSELLISQTEEELSGSAVAATMEGLRPMLIETQALVSKAVFGNPQRTATGFDLRRLNMLLAVLEKRGGMPFAQQDVFLNMAGGIRVDDPATDLAVVAALLSSLQDVAVPRRICFAGEVGLSGEIRSVNRIEQRIQEADRLGFDRIFISKYNTKGLERERFRIQVDTIARLEELIRLLFV